MEGFGGLFGDPDELQRRMAEFAEQMQGQQRLAWADNAIKLAVDMTVAAINRVNLQGSAEQQAAADPRGDGARLPRGRHTRSRGPRGAAVGRLALPRRRPPRAVRAPGVDHLLERAEAEDEEHREQADPGRQRRDHDLLADGVGDDRASRGAKTFT